MGPNYTGEVGGGSLGYIAYIVVFIEGYEELHYVQVQNERNPWFTIKPHVYMRMQANAIFVSSLYTGHGIPVATTAV